MQNTIEEKLKQLLKIQNIDMQLNDIEEIKGDLPDEAKTLASELDAMQTRLQQDQKDVAKSKPLKHSVSESKIATSSPSAIKSSR